MSQAKSEQATLGGGCFWCLEVVYQQVKGVRQVVSGYAGGQVVNPTYEQVSAGATGHAEVVQLTYVDVSYEQLLEIFWVIHDPTTPNRQGNDVGSQYRSIILYQNDHQKASAGVSREAAQKIWERPIVTEIVPLEAFYPAEEYHQNYFKNHPDQAYCQVVIAPKLQKLQQKFATLLGGTL